MKKALFVFLSIMIYGLIPLSVSAQVVGNLTPTVSSIFSGQPAGFTWSLSNSSGSSFVFPCQTGVSATISDTGKSVTCGAENSVSNANGGGASLIINNISGTAKSVSFQVIPKDLAGNDYPAGTNQTTITVYSLANPISDASFSGEVATSGMPTTLTWSGSIIPGVNIILDCNNNIYATSSSYTSATYLPCGRNIFDSDFGASGSLPITFTSLNGDQQIATVHIIPSIIAGSYDGIHQKSVSVTVVPQTIISTSVSSFTASSTSVSSDGNIGVAWSIQNAAGTNFTLYCDSMNVQVTAPSIGSNALPCNQQYIKYPDFGPNGTLTFHFKNLGSYTQQVTLRLVPSPSAGQYDATKSQTITISVAPAGSVAPASANTATATNTNAPTGFKKARVVFTRAIRFGSRGDDVAALQEFFSQDSTIYPEGLTTGYFGPATLRAIQRFQAKYGIATSGTPETTGYGALGPKTRTLVNSFK